MLFLPPISLIFEARSEAWWQKHVGMPQKALGCTLRRITSAWLALLSLAGLNDALARRLLTVEVEAPVLLRRT